MFVASDKNNKRKKELKKYKTLREKRQRHFNPSVKNTEKDENKS